MSKKTRRTIIIITVIILCIGALFNYLSIKKSPIQFDKNDPWRLYSTDIDNKYGTYIGNGFIGARIMGEGLGSQYHQSLPCYMAGLYSNENLMNCPNWTDFRLCTNELIDYEIDKNDIYLQTLNMKNGTLTTKATWKAGKLKLKGTVVVFASRVRKGIGVVRFNLTSNADTVVYLESRNTNTPSQLIPVSFEDKKSGAVNEAASLYKISDSNLYLSLSTASQSKSTFIKGKKRFIWAISSLAKSSVKDECLKTAKSELESCRKLFREDRKDGLSQAQSSLVKEHINAWNKIWKSDIIIEGNAKDQQSIHSCMYYLLQSIREGMDDSIAPMGLSNTSFNGHIFWDADTWMFPALILQYPEFAKSIVDYRFRTLAGAKENAKRNGFAGAEYAWESGLTGIEANPSIEMVDERHITGDVALAQWQYYLFTGDDNWLKERGYPVIKETADYWVSRVKIRADNTYGILAVIPPDENAGIVDNSVYTNAIAKLNLQIAEMAADKIRAYKNPKWKQIADNMYIPFDEKANRFIAYDGFKSKETKQADTELLIYPLQFEMPGKAKSIVYKNTADFYFPKVKKKGPAMSYSVHSIIASRLDDPNAYAYFKKSYEPLFRGSLNYFNEKNSLTYENMYFLTGAAGVIQAVYYGFGGVTLDYYNTGSQNIHTLGKLPKEWKKLTITNAKWRGKTFDITVNK